MLSRFCCYVFVLAFLVFAERCYWFFFVFFLYRYADISPGPGQHYIFALERTAEVPRGHIGFSLVQRKWATLSINQDIEVRPYRFDAHSDVITLVSFETDFLQKKT